MISVWGTSREKRGGKKENLTTSLSKKGQKNGGKFEARYWMGGKDWKTDQPLKGRDRGGDFCEKAERVR